MVPCYSQPLVGLWLLLILPVAQTALRFDFEERCVFSIVQFLGCSALHYLL